MRRLLTMLLVFLPAAALAGTIRMEEAEVEGHVHKPEVMFITDRSQRVDDIHGPQGLKVEPEQSLSEESRVRAAGRVPSGEEEVENSAHARGR